jgi:hypothetical protein
MGTAVALVLSQMRTAIALAVLIVGSLTLLACGDGSIFQVSTPGGSTNPEEPKSAASSEPTDQNGETNPVVLDGGSGFLAWDGGRPAQQDAGPGPSRQDASPAQQDAAPASECNPPCQTGETCHAGQCAPPEPADPYAADKQHCVEVINQYRAQVGKPGLAQSAALEECADEGAQQDAASGRPHGHALDTSFCHGTADAENETPGWPLSMYGSIRTVIDESTKMMFEEGPGGGHYQNIIGSHVSVGCGIYVTSAGKVWIVQDYK